MSGHSKGPVDTPPGTRIAPPPGTFCDNHQTRPAYRRIQGQTDEQGCEYIDECRECYEANRQEENVPENLERCDECGDMKNNVTRLRDPSDGSVSDICPGCIYLYPDMHRVGTGAEEDPRGGDGDDEPSEGDSDDDWEDETPSND